MSMTEAERFTRERALAVNRSVYEWDRLPGLPAFCKGLPKSEDMAKLETERFMFDLGTSLFEAAMSKIGFAKRLKSKDSLDAYSYLRPYGKKPSVAGNWQEAVEFARKTLFSHERPSFAEVEDAVANAPSLPNN